MNAAGHTTLRRHKLPTTTPDGVDIYEARAAMWKRADDAKARALAGTATYQLVGDAFYRTWLKLVSYGYVGQVVDGAVKPCNLGCELPAHVLAAALASATKGAR